VTRPARSGDVLPAAAVRGTTARRWTAEIAGWRPKTKHFGVNARLNRWATARYVADAHNRTGKALALAGWPRHLAGPAVVTITLRQRLGPEMDSDQVAIVPKAVRDAVAKWLHTNDSPRDPIIWHYGWERGPDGVLLSLEEVMA
jgi:hypothetical protein